MAVRVLYCGDTQAETLITAKGMDTFTLNYYRDSASVLREALGPRPGIALTHMPADKVRAEFPMTPEQFAQWDVIILSDVGYNNLALLPGNRERVVPMGPDRIGNFRKWVEGGGGLIMNAGTTLGEWKDVATRVRSVDRAGRLVERAALARGEHATREVIGDLPPAGEYCAVGCCPNLRADKSAIWEGPRG